MEASDVPMAALPRVDEEETLRDWEERSSLPCCRDLHEVQMRVQERLRRTAGRHDQPAALADNDAASTTSFQRRLARHLQRMPPRYLADVDADDKAGDVLLHWTILDESADPDKRPVFHARHVKSITVPAGYNNCSYEELEKPCRRLMKGLSLEREAAEDNDSMITSARAIHIHEIIFCSLDKPKLLCRLSQLFDEVGLHVREGHLYCTVDGFCLALFLVDGWETEETGGLIAKIKMALALKNQSNSTNSPASEKMLGLQQKQEILKLTGENANKEGNIAS